VLLVSLDHLGDLVFASALADPILQRFPGVHLDVWCREYAREVAALIPGVRRVFAVDPFWVETFGVGRGTKLQFLREVRRLRQEPHDVALIAFAPWRTAAAVAMTGTPVRIGHARRRNGFFLTHTLPGSDPLRPVVAEEARLLTPLGIVGVDLRARLDPTRINDQIRRVRSLVSGPIAALHPFANDRRRCVALDVWNAVAGTLADRGFHVVWIGRADELAEIRAVIPSERWHYVDGLGDGGMRDLTAVLATSAIVIGHDSGPVHVGNAFGVASVGVFAPGEPKRTFPQGIGPWRMVARSSPDEITAGDILQAAHELIPTIASPR
jgi:ADP-heptose:LPS heptosyltransferase